MYGIEAWKNHDGFTGAQAALNLFETVGYFVYLWVVHRYGTGDGGAERGFFGNAMKALGFDGSVGGGWGGVACLAGFALSIITLSKTVLYCESPPRLLVEVCVEMLIDHIWEQGSTKLFLASRTLVKMIR